MKRTRIVRLGNDIHHVVQDELPSQVPDRVLSRVDILTARDLQQVLIEPFDDRCVKGSSVDVRLGDTYYVEQETRSVVVWDEQTDVLSTHLPELEHGWMDARRFPAKPILNPFDEKSVKAMWGEPKKAEPLLFNLPGIPAGTPVIVVPPGANLRCHTHEFIGSMHPELTFMVKARSSTGRNCVRICACAGWGDQGYANRITLEVVNDSQYRSVILKPGMRIGQIVFIPTTPLSQGEMYFKGGKYQKDSPAGKSFDALLSAWQPDEMLPKMYLDWDLTEAVL